MHDHANSKLPTWRSLPRADRRFAFLVGIVLVIVTGLPFVYGWLRTPEGYTFTGIPTMTAGDQHVYYSYIEQARDGAFAFRDLYTSEEHIPMVQLPWLAVGLIARATRLSAPIAFHLTRLLIIVPFTMFLAVFTATFIRIPFAGITVRTLRRVALLLIVFGSGVGALLGWPLLPSISEAFGKSNWPMDFWVPEVSIFLTILRSPHFLVSTWCMLATYISIVRYDETRRNRYVIHTMIAAALLFAIHPFYLPSIPAIVLAYAIMRMLQERRFLSHLALLCTAVGFAALPPFTYWFLLSKLDLVHVARAAQNLLWTNDPWSVAMSYGLLGVAGIAGGAFVLRNRTTRATPALVFLVTWAIVNAPLLYAPFPWQRRFVEGFAVALALLTTFALATLVQWARRRIPMRWQPYCITPAMAWVIAVPVFGFSTMIAMIREPVHYALRFPTIKPKYMFYYPTAGIEAMRWLHTHAALDAVTIAPGETSNFLPGWAARPIFAGHSVETVGQSEKAEAFGTFLEPTTSTADRWTFLERYGIDYLFDPHFDSRHPYVAAAAQALKLPIAYKNPQVTIYRVLQ